MNTTTTAAPQIDAIQLLEKYANQRPGLDPFDYGDYRAYRNEAAEITRDLSDFRELLALALRRYDRERLNNEIIEHLRNSSGRLTLNDSGQLEYVTGQYWPTEYRPACSAVLKRIIWKDYQEETGADGSPTYKDGHEIRAAIKRNLSRRTYRNYFKG